MSGSSRAPARITLSIASALLIAVPPLYFLVRAIPAASEAGLGRDQGIFQGTAWAIAHGAVLYRDLREINGPLIHELHLFASFFGGFAPHALRCFDLWGSACVFALFGSALPGALRPAAATVSLRERLAWAAATASALFAQYLALYNYWHMTQRESFFDWFVLLAFASLFFARGCERACSARVWVVIAGVASVTPWFGKPQCVVYTAAHALCLAAGGARAPLALRTRARAFALGFAIGCALQLAFFARFADIGAFVEIYLRENPRYYRYIWPRSLEAIVRLPRRGEWYAIGFGLALLTIALAQRRRLGFQALGLAAFPVIAIGLDLLQHKGFVYHLHPVTAGSTALALGLSCHFASSASEPSPRVRPLIARFGALGSAAVLAAYLTHALANSPHHTWLTRIAEPWPSPRYLARFDTRTFDGSGMVRAGAFLRAHTPNDARIQLYGMDVYLLALAERMPATPYVYDIDLNPDAVLAGIRKQGGSASALATARALAARNVRDFVARIARDPPAAFVFFDRAPFLHPANAFKEFAAHVPSLVPMLRARYREQPAFGLVHVYLRSDLASSQAQSLGTGTPPVVSK